MSLFGASFLVLLFYVLLLFLAAIGEVAGADALQAETKANYAPAQAIPISCLNRTM